MIRKTCRIAAVATWLLLLATWAHAGNVTIAWDPNAETNITGYKVYWGAKSGVYTGSASAGTATSYTVENLTAGTYYFAVQAINSDGLASPMSVEVSATIEGANPNGETVESWMSRFSITDMSADADNDGVSNSAEFAQGTDPTLPNTWHLAEGSTGFFRERLAMANPGTDTAQVTITFLREGQAPITREYTVAAKSRQTIIVNDIAGLENCAVSADITATRGGVVVERTMSWGGDNKDHSAHTGKAVETTSTTWYFAEGEARFFDTYLLLANSNSSGVTVNVTYLLEDGSTIENVYGVPASSRRTINTNAVPGLSGRSFSISIAASAPITAERSMYFSAHGEWWKGGHESVGVTAPQTQWFIAEGRTGSFFDEYILLANPNTVATTVTIRYLRPYDPVITATYTLAPLSRRTILVDGIPGLEDTDVSASISATQPIVAERSMYWAGEYTNWYEGHNSMAVGSTGTLWALAEGETGGSNAAESYVLIANPSDTDAAVTVTFLRESGSPIVVTRTVAANSRMTLCSAQMGFSGHEKFGATVESTNAVPIVVERSMYWDAMGLFWGAGTNETAIKLR